MKEIITPLRIETKVCNYLKLMITKSHSQGRVEMYFLRLASRIQAAEDKKLALTVV